MDKRQRQNLEYLIVFSHDSLKTGRDSSTAKRSAISVSVTGLGDDHYKRVLRVKIVVAR